MRLHDIIRRHVVPVLCGTFFGCLPLGVLGNPNQARTDGFVTTDDGIKLYYVEMGAGNDVLVAPMAVYLEPHLLGALSTNRRVIFYDPRNRGRSDAAELDTVSLDRQVRDLENLRAELGLEKIALLGWSGLGMEMAVYTLRHPERVTRLVQMSPVPPAASIMHDLGDARNDQLDRTEVETLDARAKAGEFEDHPEVYCRLVNALTGPTNFVDTTLVREIPDVCAHENEWPRNLWPYFDVYLATFGDYDWRADLRDLDTPRLIIHGREDGIPLSGAKAWAAGFRQARLMVLSPSGHFPFIEQRETVIEAIEVFLQGAWPSGAREVASDP